MKSIQSRRRKGATLATIPHFTLSLSQMTTLSYFSTKKEYQNKELNEMGRIGNRYFVPSFPFRS